MDQRVYDHIALKNPQVRDLSFSLVLTRPPKNPPIRCKLMDAGQIGGQRGANRRPARVGRKAARDKSVASAG